MGTLQLEKITSGPTSYILKHIIRELLYLLILLVIGYGITLNMAACAVCIDVFVFQIDGMNMEDMRQTMRKYDLKSPLTANELSDPMEFNLMFSTSIGPSGQVKG